MFLSVFKERRKERPWVQVFGEEQKLLNECKKYKDSKVPDLI